MSNVEKDKALRKVLLAGLHLAELLWRTFLHYPIKYTQ